MTSDKTTVHYDALGEAGLRFFGRVSASISHEIKNVLAIINENTGLLEDLSFAAMKGSAIDPERLNKACRQFTKQIQRADTIMKNMSHFAHSVDRFDGQVNLHELAGLVANLAGRLAAMRKITIQVEQPTSPVIYSGNPFLLQNLIWLCLEFAFGAASPGSTLMLIPASDDSGLSLRIGGLDNLDPDFSSQLPTGISGLQTALGANLSADLHTKELILHIP